MAAWSPDDVRKQAPNWSLEGDGKLLEYMESISKTLDEKCNTTLTNINKMLLSIDETNVALGNTTNKLLALQHAQFVENRVYEEDETTVDSLADSGCDVNGNSVKQSTIEVWTPMGAIQVAVDNGITMLRDCYEKVSLDLDDESDDDNDEEVGVTNIVFQPKDPYIDKPLPFIIGSKEWKEKWHVGLLESDLESDNENEVEQFSDTSSSNPSLSTSIPSNAPTISESEGSVWGLTTPGATPSNSKLQKDLFNDSSSSEESDRGVSRNVNLFDPNDVISKHKQMKKEQTPTIHERPSTHPSGTVVQPQQTIFREQQPARIIVNLFDDEPPELDVSSSSSSLSKPVAVAQPNRTKPLNLFDESDNDNDDDIFLTKKPSHKPSKPSVNLFSDTPPADEHKEISKTKPARTVTNLFDDDNDDDDIGVVTVVKPPAPTARSRITNLFDDDVPDDDLDLFIESKKTKSKIAASSSSSSVSEAKLVAAPLKITKLFDDDYGVDEENTKSKMTASSSSPSSVSEAKKPVTASSKIRNLFDDDDDDDNGADDGISKIFPKPTDVKPTVVSNEIKKPVVNLFSGDEEMLEEKDVVHPVPVPAARTIKPEVTKPKIINLFDDDDDDDFSTLLSKTKETSIKSESVRPPISNILENKNDLPPPTFENDEKIEVTPPLIIASDKVKTASVKKLPPHRIDDIEKEFKSTSTTKSSDAPKIPEESVPIVNEVKKEENPEAEVKIVKEPNKLISLFSDEPPDDDFDELFTTKARKSSKPPPEIPPLDENDDEDWLVSSNKSLSIFDKFNDVSNVSTEIAPPSPSESKSSVTPSALQFSSVRLFDDMPPDDEDDDIREPPPILSSSSSSKSHIYYDDTDTFNAVDLTKSPPASAGYVINEEPPLDNYQIISNKDEPDRTAPANTNFKEKLNAFKNSSNSSGNTSSSDSDKKIKTQPKKLNTNNISINVGALLPGAKRPSASQIIKRNSTTSSDENISSSVEEKHNTTPKYNEAVTKTVVTEDGDKNVLQSLQKSRAKIQFRRRPSTRQARYDVYRKSIVEDDAKIESDTPSKTASKSEEPISITQALLNLRNDDKKSEFVERPEVSEISKPKQTSPFEPKKNSLFDDDEFEIPKSVSIVKNVKEPPKKISLFDDDNLITAPTPIFAVTKHVVQEVEPPKTIVPEITRTKNTEIEQQSTKKVSLFDDDEDDDLFRTKPKQMGQEKPPIPTLKESVKPAIFEDDTDDLFAKVSSIQKIDIKPTVTQQKQPLFSSDEDNDLFGNTSLKKPNPQPPSQQQKIQTTTTKKPPQTKSKTSNVKLFDSDDDHEDDLFGPPSSSLSSASTKTTTSGKKSISQSLLFAKSTANNKLFDDSDGDDGNDEDLFKSKFIPAGRVPISSNKSISSLSKSDKKVIKSTEVTNSDPLADLLK